MWALGRKAQLPELSLHSFSFVLPGGTQVVVAAFTAQEALDFIRREYGSRAYREAWMIS